MKKKSMKKWLYWLVAIFMVILAIGCTADIETDTINGIEVKSESDAVAEVEDKAPVITARNQTVDYGAELSYSELATVEDADSEDVRLSITSSELSGVIVDNDSQIITFVATGNFEIDLTATDEEGNATTEKVLITVEDHVAPTLTLSSTSFSLTAGDSAPNYASIAKASDNADGDITGSIIVNSSKVNCNSAGTYQITYTVTDSSGNTTTQIATVTVIAKPATSSSNSSSDTSTAYVLITRTGECYHKRKCGNGNFFEVTLEEALGRGLRKCKKCY